MLADITSEQWPASGWNQWPTSSEYTALASVVFWAVVALIVVLIDSAQQDLMGTVVGVVLSLPIVAAVAWIVWEEFFPSGHSPASNRRSKP